MTDVIKPPFDFGTRMGEAVANPAANSMLGRLKAVVDAVAGMEGALDGLAVAKDADVIDLAPPLDTNQYGSGDVLFIPVLLAHISRENGGAGWLKSVLVLDVDDLGGAFDLYFLRTTQDVGTINNALAMSDAEAAELLGWIEIQAADYKDHGDQKAAFLTAERLTTRWNVDLLEPAADTRDIYVFGVSRDTKTYSAAALKFKFNVVFFG